VGLYLCVFDDDKELDGVDVGSYDDFHSFRSAVVDRLEGGRAGAKYPTLIIHHDSAGEWKPDQCAELEKELHSIAIAFQDMPPSGFDSGWQKEAAKLFGLRPANLCESFIDVDGELLIERLLTLCRLAQERGQPILFQ
jgi:hypothetical protein